MVGFNFGSETNIKKGKRVGSLRRSQLITTYGPGCIIDMVDYSVILAASDYWDKVDANDTEAGETGRIIHDMNLERILGVKHFRQPDIEEKDDYTERNIPAFRFPVMHFCPSCGKLSPFYTFGKEENNICATCKKKIIPSRFITVCEHGHIDDFPYDWWVHRGGKCSVSPQKPNLKIEFSKEISMLDGIKIICQDCKAERTMSGAMSSNGLIGAKCFGKRPWIGSKPGDQEDDCDAQPRACHRTASNVYFPVTYSALTIPPWSDRLNQEIAKHWDKIKGLLSLALPDEKSINPFLESYFNYLINEGYSASEIMEGIKKHDRAKSADSGYDIQHVREDEYKVLCKDNYDRESDLQYRRIKVDVPTALRPFISQIGKVKRLREVMVQAGFNRLKYDFKDYIPLSQKKLDWLPAVEMIGEGIFIKLNPQAVKDWETANADRYKLLQERIEASTLRCPNFSARYVLLHTLAHLLIRQLAFNCGYSGASIKERIYSTYPGSSVEMAGILLYTSSSDADGSLGGLARQAEGDLLEQLVFDMLENASWCSSDPLCGDSLGQGYDALNYAACHACTLLPETCCEMRNCLLDRISVVGKIDDREIGFFSDLLD